MKSPISSVTTSRVEVFMIKLSVQLMLMFLYTETCLFQSHKMRNKKLDTASKLFWKNSLCRNS